MNNIVSYSGCFNKDSVLLMVYHYYILDFNLNFITYLYFNFICTMTVITIKIQIL